MTEYKAYCTDCRARHEVGLEFEPEERVCQCGGYLKPISDMTYVEALEYERDWLLSLLRHHTQQNYVEGVA